MLCIYKAPLVYCIMSRLKREGLICWFIDVKVKADWSEVYCRAKANTAYLKITSVRSYVILILRNALDQRTRTLFKVLTASHVRVVRVKNSENAN